MSGAGACSSRPARPRGRGPGLGALLLACGALAACGGGPDERDAAARPDDDARPAAGAGAADEPSGAPDPSAAEPAPGCAAFATRGLAVSVPTRRAFREAVGEPDTVTRTPVENRHVEGQIDTLVVFGRSGLRATYYVQPERDLLSSVSVRDARWLRYSAPTIGSRGSEVEALLGPPGGPATSADSILSYVCPPSPGAEEPVLFALRDGVVTEVRFTRYVD